MLVPRRTGLRGRRPKAYPTLAAGGWSTRESGNRPSRAAPACGDAGRKRLPVAVPGSRTEKRVCAGRCVSAAKPFQLPAASSQRGGGAPANPAIAHRAPHRPAGTQTGGFCRQQVLGRACRGGSLRIGEAPCQKEFLIGEISCHSERPAPTSGNRGVPALANRMIFKVQKARGDLCVAPKNEESIQKESSFFD